MVLIGGTSLNKSNHLPYFIPNELWKYFMTQIEASTDEQHPKNSQQNNGPVIYCTNIFIRHTLFNVINVI